ncbi:MAG: KPN_02809 family neutral zinc metallopeptidase [Myxococcota bacterium]
MRWKPGQRSKNLEDRRGQSGRRRSPFPFPFPSRGGGGRGRGRIPMPRARGPRMSLGGIVLMLVIFFFLNRAGLLPQTTNVPGGSALPSPGTQRAPEPLGSPRSPGSFGPSAGAQGSPAEEQLVDFVSFVLDDVQTMWAEVLPGYRDAKLVLFRGTVQSGCGFAAAQMGPFYCPTDEKVYVDLSFYEEMRTRFGAPGDFAQAYVLAHEIGHHVQKITGIEREVRSAQARSRREKNPLSVKMELQADCFAGVWGGSAGQRGILEHGDVEEGLRAAAAIGDDRLQKMQTGRVQPEGFTHGSSEQRMRWLRQGLEVRDPDRCDTFAVARP